MNIGNKTPRVLAVFGLIASLGLGASGRAQTFSSKSDFATIRLELGRQVEKEVKLALGAVPNDGLRAKASRLFGVKSGDLDIVSRLLASALIADVLPAQELNRPPLPVYPGEWDAFAREPAYAVLRLSVLHRVNAAMAEVGMKESPAFRSVSCGGGDWVHGILTETVSLDSGSGVYEVCDRFAPTVGTWDGWKKSLTENRVRTPASIDDEAPLVAPEDFDDGDRSPASSAKNKTVAKTKSRTTASARRSRLPSSVADGFELRFQYGKMVSTFWVVKRGNNHDLLFTNSEGSKAKLTLPAESFSYLQSTARSIQSESTDLKKCGNASMQMHVVAAGQPERSVTTCFKTKSKSAEGIRSIGNLLSTMVR